MCVRVVVVVLWCALSGKTTATGKAIRLDRSVFPPSSDCVSYVEFYLFLIFAHTYLYLYFRELNRVVRLYGSRMHTSSPTF